MASVQISVSSVTYPLAGTDEPTNYLKSIITGHVLLQASGTYGQSIQKGLINGPALRLRGFAKWANSSNYSAAVGTPVGSIHSGDGIDESVLENEIPHGFFESVVVNSAVLGPASVTYWADRFIYEEYPDEIGTSYTVDVSTDGSEMIITLADGTVVTEPLSGYVPEAQYLFSYYQICSAGGSLSTQKVFIYQQGTGKPALDAFFADAVSFGTYLPIIPVRINNAFINEDNYPSLYPLVKKAMKKSLPSGNFDKLVKDLVANNDNIGDIDHATIMFGVPLNTKAQEGKQYIYEFMSRIFLSQGGTQSSIIFNSTGTAISFTTRIIWSSIARTVGSGVIFPNAKVGDVNIYSTGTLNLYMQRQTGPNSYEQLYFFGFLHENMVYKYKAVVTYSSEAMVDEDPSSFLFPMDVNIFNSLGLVDANQLGNYLGFMIFNCYEETKRKWYEGGILNLALIVVVVAVSVTTAGAGTGASAGVLGSSLSIGTALGFAGAMALFVGTIANAIAAMLLIRILQVGATAIFGEKVGIIIGTIAGMVAVAYGSAYANNQPMSGVLGQLSQPENLMKLTSSVGKGYSEYLQGEVADMQSEIGKLTEEANRIQTQIKELTAKNLSSGSPYLTSRAFTDTIAQAGESSDSFLVRTLMTGTDIAEISLSMLENYASISLDVNL